jgi:hypothetical protein
VRNTASGVVCNWALGIGTLGGRKLAPIDGVDELVVSLDAHEGDGLVLGPLPAPPHESGAVKLRTEGRCVGSSMPRTAA